MTRPRLGLNHLSDRKFNNKIIFEILDQMLKRQPTIYSTAALHIEIKGLTS